MGTMTDKARNRARKGWHRITEPHRCADCNKDYRTIRAMNAHHMSVHAGLWSSKKARAAGRTMGKKADAARRHAMGWRVSAGLAEVRGQRVVATNKSRSRTELRGKLSLRSLRDAHRHDRQHERASRADQRADRAARRNDHGTAGQHRQRAHNLRGYTPVPESHPSRQRPVPAPRPAPAASGHSNGRAKAPAKAGRAGR